ncbi:hypothetical protein D9619_010919 [Psilocybe cf. subviscida]|uniref:FAD/NAD(P)-binding domain-containing protein n=1 Tax=Psilocybe cf. subviscida TaxID=2480587 RepID=A0A8H5B9D1_9AGAR|nr:hypothetical protein D9619_010919 [Psilocybe cf. subviscida]
MEALSKKRVVVVGGGGAGASIVRGLSKALDPAKHELILVTARPQVAYLPASLRVLVDKDTPHGMMFWTYETVFDKFPGELIVGTVSSIEENGSGFGGRVLLTSGTHVQFDVLAVATGSVWKGLVSFPNEEAVYKAHIELWRGKFAVAQHIVIVGGGAVGIEAAGEIKDIYPDKNVTIVHSGKYLLTDMYPREFRVGLEKKLRLRGVAIIFEDIIEGDPEPDHDGFITSRSGQRLKCDLMISARGAGPNTALFKNLQPSPLNERGYVQVTPTLQVQDHLSIFAAGDITNLPEAKQYAKTAGHARTVVANIVSLLKNEVLKKETKAGAEVIIISNGRHGGAAYLGNLGILGGVKLGDLFVRVAKSRDLLVGVARREIGLSWRYQ